MLWQSWVVKGLLKALGSIPVLLNKGKLVQYVRQQAITGALGMGRGRAAEREDCRQRGLQTGRITLSQKRWDHDEQKKEQPQVNI